MADNAKLILPGEFDPAKTYLVKGSTLAEWQRNLIRDRVIAGAGIKETQDPNGRIFEAAAGAGSSEETGGSFCRVFLDDGDWFLTGGQVSGGEGNETIADINLGSVASPPSDGTHRWLSIGYTANVEDDVLLPGGEVTSASVSSGSSIPSNTIPTVSSPSGTIRVSLGSWSGGVFVPSGCGNIQIHHCPGSLTYSRA